VTRAHVIAWRDSLAGQGLSNDTIRRKLAALSSLYAYLCDRNAVLHNPVLGVKRPRSMNREGVTPALSDHQAWMLLKALPVDTLKGKCDQAILATLLYHGLRCEELCTLLVSDSHQREGVPHIRVEGKGAPANACCPSMAPILSEFFAFAVGERHPAVDLVAAA
jgi:site-specific recombinase XerD